MGLATNKYPNNVRTVKSGEYEVEPNDSLIQVDTTFDPSTTLHTTTLDLQTFTANNFDTQYKLYIQDIGNSAATYPITILAPTGFLINNQQTITINVNNGGVMIRILSNGNYIAVFDNAVNSGGISSPIIVKNTVFVMKNGSDLTGVVERFDKPFLTIAGATAAINAYYTGSNLPSQTNRIMIRVYSGTYTEQIILTNCVDLDLGDCVINNITPNASIITDNGASVDSIIYGQANLTSTTSGGTSTTAINIFGDSTVVMSFNSLNVQGTASGTLQGIVSSQGSYLTIQCNSVIVRDSTATVYGVYAKFAGELIISVTGTIFTSTAGFNATIAAIGGNNSVISQQTLLKFNGNLILTKSSNGNPMYSILARNGGQIEARCNDIVYEGGIGLSYCSAVCVTGGTPVTSDSAPSYLYLWCNTISVAPDNTSSYVSCCQIGTSNGSEITKSATLYVECNTATLSQPVSSTIKCRTWSTIYSQNNDVNCVATFKGKYIAINNSDGTNPPNGLVSILTDTNTSYSTLIFDCASFVLVNDVNINTFYATVNTNSATNNIIRIYGACQSNQPVESTPTYVTLNVGTVANGRFIQSDANVI